MDFRRWGVGESRDEILDDGGEWWFKEIMKATLILLNVLIVSLLNAGNPIEEAGSKHKNAEAENRKKQLIQTLENSDAKLYYEEDFPGKDAPPKKNARVNGEKNLRQLCEVWGSVQYPGDGWKKRREVCI